MKDSSGKRRLVKKYVSDFIFSEKTRFVLDTGSTSLLGARPGSKFIKFSFEKKPGHKKRKIVFRCIYKMMKNFQLSLN